MNCLYVELPVATIVVSRTERFVRGRAATGALAAVGSSLHPLIVKASTVPAATAANVSARPRIFNSGILDRYSFAFVQNEFHRITHRGGDIIGNDTLLHAFLDGARAVARENQYPFGAGVPAGEHV